MNAVRIAAGIILLIVGAECFLRLIDYRDPENEALKAELAEQKALVQRLQDFKLKSDLMVNELMVVHVPDKSGNYFGRTRSFLVPVHGVKSYPIADDCDELGAIRKAIAEYVKDNYKEMEK